MGFRSRVVCISYVISFSLYNQAAKTIGSMRPNLYGVHLTRSLNREKEGALEVSLEIDENRLVGGLIGEA
jgi:hypothetical protein